MHGSDHRPQRTLAPQSPQACLGRPSLIWASQVGDLPVPVWVLSLDDGARGICLGMPLAREASFFVVFDPKRNTRVKAETKKSGDDTSLSVVKQVSPAIIGSYAKAFPICI